MIICEHCHKPIPNSDLPVVLKWGDRPEHLPNFFGRAIAEAIHFNCQEGYNVSNPTPKRGRGRPKKTELIEALPEGKDWIR
jgi:hypothetical protein